MLFVIFHLSWFPRDCEMAEVTANAIEERLIGFAVRIVKLADALPETLAGKHIARQLLRSGTSPAPNYAEARVAESHADFIHKLKIVRITGCSARFRSSCAHEPLGRWKHTPTVRVTDGLCFLDQTVDQPVE